MGNSSILRVFESRTQVWDVAGQNWVAMTQPSISTDVLNVTVESPLAVTGTFFQATQPVSLATAPTTPVTGTFWQATQPISAAALPLPAGAATLAGQTQPGIDIGDVTINNASAGAAVNVQDGGNSLTVDGVFFQATQPVSAAALPLPAGAATAANQTLTSFGKTITYVSVAQGAAGTTVLAAASPGNKHKIIGASLVMDATGTAKFSDGGADLTGAMALATNGGFVWHTSLLPYQETALNSALNLVTTVGAAKGVVQILTEP